VILLDSDSHFPWPLGLMRYQGQYMTVWFVLAFITLSILPAVGIGRAVQPTVPRIHNPVSH
jgi:hypothetical protein